MAPPLPPPELGRLFVIVACFVFFFVLCEGNCAFSIDRARWRELAWKAEKRE